MPTWRVYAILKIKGRLRLVSRPCDVDTCLIESERVRHYVHRHEPPTLDAPITIIAVTDSLVAVCKPASMVVHPSGQYRKNTVTGVLLAQRPDLYPLHPVHRLDKPVSGLLILARTGAAANEIRQMIEGDKVQKEYIARVKGVLDMQAQATRAGVTRMEDGWLRVDVALAWDPRDHIVHSIAPGAEVPAAAPGGDGPLQPKTAQTLIRLLEASADGQTSLVECRPLTGRTHQIRVHLQYLEHPILNDALYGGSLQDDPFGGTRYHKSAATQAQEIEDAAARLAASREAEARGEGAAEGAPLERLADALPGLGFKWDGEVDPLCACCPYTAARGYTESDLTPLFLHAIRYACAEKGWSFESPRPEWATGDVRWADLKARWGQVAGVKN